MLNRAHGTGTDPRGDPEAARSEEPPSHPVQYLWLHEIAHALGIGYDDYGRRLAEVLVDTVTFVVCAGVGLDVSGESLPYVAGWGDDAKRELWR